MIKNMINIPLDSKHLLKRYLDPQNVPKTPPEGVWLDVQGYIQHLEKKIPNSGEGPRVGVNSKGLP